MIAGGIPQIDKQIFDFECPVFGKRHFNPGADSLAEFRTALVWQAGQGRFYIRARAAGSPVDENAIPRIAEARAERSQPIARGLAAQSGCGRRRNSGEARRNEARAKTTVAGPLETLPIKVAFDAEHPCAPLATNTYCSANQTAIDVEVPG